MVSDPASENSEPRPDRGRGRPAGARAAGSRCCSGSARSSRIAGAWSLPGGELAPRRDARGSRSAATSRPRSTCASSPTSSSSRRAATRTATRCAGSSRPPTSASSRPTSTRRSPPTRAGTRSTTSRTLAFDHGPIVLAGRERLRAKLSYTNIGFALAPRARSRSRELRDLYRAALGHDVSATNLQRVLVRRHLLVADRHAARAGPGGRPPGGALRLPHAGRSRSPTSSRCCGRLRPDLTRRTSVQAAGSAAAAR